MEFLSAYGFTICDNKLHCREGYANGDGALDHLDNVEAMLQEALESGTLELTDLQIHGTEQELAKMREPLANFVFSYWVLEYDFRDCGGIGQVEVELHGQLAQRFVPSE